MRLDPKDDYPDSFERLSDDQVRKGARPVDFAAELAKPGKALRDWVAASPRRALSPDLRLLALARDVAYEREWATAPLLPVLRPVRKGDYARSCLSVRGVDASGAKRRLEFVMPEGVSIREVAIADDGALSLGLELAAGLAKKLGVPARVTVPAPFAAIAKLPQSPTQAEKPEALDTLAGLLAKAGVSGAGVTKGARAAREREARGARKAAAEAKRPKPTAKEYRAFIVEKLAKLRPALVADLRRRVFRYPFPEGTKELAFELFFDGLDRIPIVGYLMDGSGGQVMRVAKGGVRVLEPNVEVLPAKKGIATPRELERFRDVDDDPTPLVLRWFVDAWKEAGGAERFPLPASIQYHDGGRLTKLPSRAR